MISKAGFDGNLVINRFAKFLQYLMTLSHLSTNIDSILMNYANIMTGFSTSLSNYFTNILRLLIAFWGGGRGGGGYYYGDRDWNSDEYWRVSLSESIRYTDGIFLSQERDKQKQKRIRTFSSFLGINNFDFGHFLIFLGKVKKHLFYFNGTYCLIFVDIIIQI